MAHPIGYSLIRLSDGEEISSSGGLPWQVEMPEGTASVDQVGLVLPDSANPLYKVVERWQIDEVPAGHHQVGLGTPSFDGTRINVPGIYEPRPAAEQAEIDRVGGITKDTDYLDLRNRLNSMSATEIKNFIDTNVTDLASVKTVLKKMALLLSRRG